MSNKQTQCDMILAYMKENGSITPSEAMSEFGCMRLASRICDLKRTHKIKTERVTTRGRFGPVTFARYSLENDESRNLTAEQVRAMTPAEVSENYDDYEVKPMPKIKFKNIPFRTRVRICSTPALRVCESCTFYTEAISENGVNCMLADNYDYTDTLLNLSEKEFPTNREWMESLSNEELAALMTSGLLINGGKYYGLRATITLITSKEAMSDWLSQPCVYLMEDKQ